MVNPETRQQLQARLHKAGVVSADGRMLHELKPKRLRELALELGLIEPE